jgi:hypothetical protein
MLGEFVSDIIGEGHEDAIEGLLYAVGQELGVDYEMSVSDDEEYDTDRSDL